MLAPKAEIDTAVLEQLHRAYHAVNSGTLDRETVNDALARIRVLLTRDEVEAHESGGVAPAVVTRKPPRKKR